MPIYEYRCKICKKDFDYFHLGSEDRKAKCPYCAGHDLDRLPSKNTGFELKGHGWAKDKYNGGRKK